MTRLQSLLFCLLLPASLASADTTQVPESVLDVLKKARAAGDLKPFATENKEGEGGTQVRLILTKKLMTVVTLLTKGETEQCMTFYLSPEGGLTRISLANGPKGASKLSMRGKVKNGKGMQIEALKPDGTWAPTRDVPLGQGIAVVLAHVILPRLWKHVPPAGLTFQILEEDGAKATLKVSKVPKDRPAWADKAERLVVVEVQTPGEVKRSDYLLAGTTLLAKKEPRDKEWKQVQPLPATKKAPDKKAPGETGAPPRRSGKSSPPESRSGKSRSPERRSSK